MEDNKPNTNVKVIEERSNDMKTKDNGIYLIEKTIEYEEYKSMLIRLILMKYAHEKPNCRGSELMKDIMDKWLNNKDLTNKYKNTMYERTIDNITKYEEEINNIEEILMMVSLQILENYYDKFNL